jgi:hypothetical protein
VTPNITFRYSLWVGRSARLDSMSMFFVVYIYHPRGQHHCCRYASPDLTSGSTASAKVLLQPQVQYEKQHYARTDSDMSYSIAKPSYAELWPNIQIEDWRVRIKFVRFDKLRLLYRYQIFRICEIVKPIFLGRNRILRICQNY